MPSATSSRSANRRIDSLNPANLAAQEYARASGLPGIGKTALALQAARTAHAQNWFPSGCCSSTSPERAARLS
jgi:hypothetical protein